MAFVPTRLIPPDPEWLGGDDLFLSNTDEKAVEEKLPQIRREMEQSCKDLGHILTEILGDKVYLDCSSVTRHMKNPSRAMLRNLMPVVDGKFKGTLTAEHILSIAIALRLYLQTNKNVCLHGACQSAKTLVYLMCFLLFPIFEKLIKRRIAIPLINTPNFRNLCNSTRRELRTLLDLYGDVEIEIRGRREKIAYVEDTLLRNYLQVNAANDSVWDFLVLQRNYSELERLGRTMRRNKEGTFINFTDELHYGSGVVSLQGEVIKRLGIDREIGSTATPSEIMGNHNWTLSPLWIDPASYHGIIRYNNQRLPTINGKEPSRPKNLAIENAFPDFADFLDLSKYRDDARGWRKAFAEEVYNIYKTLATPEAPIVFIRPFPERESCRILLDDLSRLIEKDRATEKYGLVRYFDQNLDPDLFGDKKSTRTIKEVLIDSFVKQKRFALVIAANGRSRMGDSYPAQCRNYIDLVKNSVGWDSMAQSTEGRAMGFGKISTCYFRGDYVNRFESWWEHGCRDESKRFNQRTNYLDVFGRPLESARGRPRQYHTVLFGNNELDTIIKNGDGK